MNTQQELAKNIQPCNTAKPYAFVSYSKKDYEIVYPIVTELQKDGYNIWIDKELTSNVGENWQDIALDSISNKRCSTILFFVSENSMLSAPVCAEITWAHSRFANRYGAMKMIPICASKTWSPRNKGIHHWILEDLANSEQGEQRIQPAEYNILRLSQMPKEMLSGPSRLQYHSDLALHLFEIHFEPNGGNNETFAFFNDTETIKKNIPEEIQIVQKRDVDFVQSPEPEQKTIPDENQPKENDVLEEDPGINALTDGSRYEEEGRTVKGDHEVAPATNTLTDSSRYEEKGQIVKDDQERNPGDSMITGGSRNKGNRQNGKRKVYRID